MAIKSVLFDLDGTLADTSLDMCNALNTILEKRGLKTVECKDLKYHISRGAVGIIKYASEVNGRSIDSSMIRSDFLEEYTKNCFVETKLTQGMTDLLDYLEKNGFRWGIVTNKHSKYVNKIVNGLNINKRISCLVTGNMVSEPKPAPDSLIHAMCLLEEEPNSIIYVGDDERDIIAGKAAGMRTAAADFGFILDSAEINTWNADNIIMQPKELIEIIN